jgi:ubiquinone biosynthesis protein
MLESIDRLRALPRLAEVVRVLARHGLHDLIHSAGLHRLIDEAAGVIGWAPDGEIMRLPLPERARLALESLGPAFVKLAQVLASRVDLLSPEWIASFDRLHDRAAPLPFERIEAQLLSDLGKPVAQAFRMFDTTACAAGSIAQVHRAALADGTTVAVKIRRPGVDAIVKADLLLLESLAAWWQAGHPQARRYRPIELVAQLRKSLSRELDFAAEGRTQERFAESFAGEPTIVIPRVHARFTTASLLVMDWIDGVPATDMAAIEGAGLDRRLLAARGTDAVLKMVLEDGLFHADPHPGNMFFLSGDRVALIDFGMTGWLSHRRRDELLDLLGAVISHDPEAMRDVLLAWADGRRVSAERFADDLGRLLHVYETATLRELSLATLLSEIAAVMREHHLMLPADLALLFKALITLEGLGTRLVPQFRLVEHVTPHVSALLAQRWTPSRLAKRAYGPFSEWARALRRAPRVLETLARPFSEEDVAVRFEVADLERSARRLQRSLDRATIGCVTTALIVGSSILLAFAARQASFAMTFFGAAGGALAVANIAWLVLSIRRTARDDSDAV